MRIVSLKKKGNDVIICFDDGEFITLDYRTILDNGLRKNDLFDEEKKERLLAESIFLKAKDSAFRYLSKRLHSASELRTKLIRKGYHQEIINKVIEELKQKSLLDDEKFAKVFIEERSIKKKIGIYKLKAELFKKGIDRNIVEKVLLDIDPVSNYENAQALVKKKIKFLETKTIDKKKLKVKLFSFLRSRGFESEIILKALNEIEPDDE